VTDPRKMRLGEILVADRAIDTGAVERALERQRATGERIGECLIALGYVDERVVFQALARQLELPYIDLDATEIDDATARLIPEHLAVARRLIACGQSGDDLLVAMSDPLDVLALDDVQVATGRKVKPMLATASAMDRALQQAYASAARRGSLTGLADPWDDLVEAPGPDRGAPDQLVEHLLTIALRRGAREVRVLPEVAPAWLPADPDKHASTPDESYAVRWTRDGERLGEVQLPRRAGQALVNHLRSLEQERYAPGRRPLLVDGQPVVVRLRVARANGALAATLRLVEPRALWSSLDDLDAGDGAAAALRAALAERAPVMAAAGPPGSGKTTTLYVLAAALAQAGARVVSVERHPDYMVDGVVPLIGDPDTAPLSERLAHAHHLRADALLVDEPIDPEDADALLREALGGRVLLLPIAAVDERAARAKLADLGIVSIAGRIVLHGPRRVVAL
jgi:type II secretory ATPase GspE/PulE/Tfp pilus assembly ATPase PilB-like protein